MSPPPTALLVGGRVKQRGPVRAEVDPGVLVSYADKAEADHARLRKAAADGRIAAEYDV